MTPLEHLNMSNLREALDAVFTPDETSFEGKIKCFISKLPNPPKVRESENAFDQLDTIIEQLTTLHCFLTVCYEKMHIDPIKYRNILISYANNSSV